MTVVGWRRAALAARGTSQSSRLIMDAALEVEQLISSGRPVRPVLAAALALAVAAGGRTALDDVPVARLRRKDEQ